MRALKNQALVWIDHRTGLETSIRKFLYEDIPASSGWHQVFGSVAVFLFLVQAFTGILLAFNYAPTPGEAYNSMRYILTEVTAGRLMHGLHHWGASMMIVVVVLHMLQVFLFGSYKKPREATWIAGVVLLLITLAYGLTGYLLPWDNKAYWATVVVTQIAAGVPLIGPYLSRLLGSTGDVGVVTFARFYAVHVLILPPATGLLILAHIYLVRKHGVAPVPGDEEQPAKKFYPRQAFLDTIAVFTAFAILFTLAVVAHLPLERLADPSDTAYIPRPEWYYLFLFQMLKYFNGPMEVIGTVVLPGLAILVLILIPFIDRSPLMRVSRRVFAMGCILLAGAGWGALTFAAMKSTPTPGIASQIDYAGPIDWMALTPVALGRGTDKTAPEFAVLGAKLFTKKGCAACHMVNGVGGKLGPPLNGLSSRRSEEWVHENFLHPQKMAPGTIMPAYPFNDADMKNMTGYLFTIPE